MTISITKRTAPTVAPWCWELVQECGPLEWTHVNDGDTQLGTSWKRPVEGEKEE